MKLILQHNLITILILMISILFVFFHINMLGESVYWWTHDGAGFIEAARNYSATGDLVVSSSIFILNDTVPIQSWPAGYPVILSYIQDILGIDSQWLAVSLSILSWAIVPSIIFIFVRPLLGTTVSVFISILVLTSPAALDWGWTDMTDMPFFLIVLVGLLLSCRIFYGWNSTVSIFIGGVLLGASYSIRYAGAAALMAIFIGYMIFFISRHDVRREVLRGILVWCVGTATILVPLLIHNVMTFGMIMPYSNRAPSTVGILVATKEYVRSSMHNIFGPGEPVFVVIAGVVIIGLCLYFFYRYSGSIRQRACNFLGEFSHFPPNIFVLIVILLYSMLGIFIVLYGRATYHWGGAISLRLVMQYDWAILTVIFFLLLHLAGEYRAKIIIYSSCVLMLIGHIYYASTEYYFKEQKFSEKMVLRYKIYNDDEISDEVVKLSKQGGFIASNLHDTLRTKTGLPIHKLYLEVDEEKLMEQLQTKLLKLQKLLHGTGKEGRIFVFLKADILDEIMEEKSFVPGVAVERWNESLLTFHFLPD